MPSTVYKSDDAALVSPGARLHIVALKVVTVLAAGNTEKLVIDLVRSVRHPKCSGSSASLSTYPARDRNVAAWV
jgi:hypothetical protein